MLGKQLRRLQNCIQQKYKNYIYDLQALLNYPYNAVQYLLIKKIYIYCKKKKNNNNNTTNQ